VLNPYVTRPDILVVMSQEAYSKFVPDLKEDGILIVEQDLVRVTESQNHLRIFSVPATRIAEDLGKRMVLNSVMVGFFTAVTQLLDPDAVRLAVGESVPSGFRELNLQAFEKGFAYGINAETLPSADLEFHESVAVEE
jgi:2-oxoglutarate ferredoxin oxidoreductase subunit gamma